MPEKFEEFIKDNAPGADGKPRDKKAKEEDPGFFRKYVRSTLPPCSFSRASPAVPSLCGQL